MALKSRAHTGRITFGPIPVNSAGGLTTYDGIKAAGHRLAIKFRAPAAVSIASVALRLVGTGTTTGITYTVEIQGDSSDAPDGTTLGAASAAQPAPTGGTQGWVDYVALGTATGNLVQGSAYWVVLKDGGDTGPNSSNYISIMGTSPVGNDTALAERLRKYESDWTSVASSSTVGLAVLKDTEGHIYPGPCPNGAANLTSGFTDIYGVNRQGVRCRFGSQTLIHGFSLAVSKNTSPSQLDVEVYKNDTLLDTLEFPAGGISTTGRFTGIFPDGVSLAPDDYLYLLLHQNADGGNDSNDYDVQGFTVTSATPDLRECLPQNVAYVYMTSANSWSSPSASLTASDTFFPRLELIFGDVNTDFDSSGSGGGPLLGGRLIG